MEKSLLLNNILDLYQDTSIVLNVKTKEIVAHIEGSEIEEYKSSLDNFVQSISKKDSLTEASTTTLLNYLKELEATDELFKDTLTLEKNDESLIEYTIRGSMLSDNEILILLSSTNRNVRETFDSLTKVYNRSVIIDKIKESINNKEEFALFIVDIDYFKEYNDTYGHMFGDIVLLETAASIKKYLGDTGFIGRIGGDEFLIYAKINNTYDDMYKTCKGIRSAISSIASTDIKQTSITATVGCAAYPQNADNYESLFKMADRALYRGKVKGRNCFIIYSEERCGSIDNEEIRLTNKDIEETKTLNNYNIVAGVFEFLHRGEGGFKKNINDALSLIGNYFQLDRIIVSPRNPFTKALDEQLIFINSNASSIKNQNTYIGDMGLWHKSVDATGMLKASHIDTIKELPIYESLASQHVTATISFLLKYGKRGLGVIRFEMCSKARIWIENDASSMMLISKLLGIYLNSRYEMLRNEEDISYDKLTKAYNYSKWLDEANNEISTMDLMGNYSIICTHFEKFPQLLDVLGIQVCNDAIVMLSNAMKQALTSGFHCRIKTDLFLVFLPSVDKAEIKKFYTKTTEYFNRYFGYSANFRITFGVYQNDGDDNLATSIDKANYTRKRPEAKAVTYLLYRDEFYEDIMKEKELENHINDAITNNEFLLYLQPRYDLNTNTIIGAEALTRWNYKNIELLKPYQYLPLFEKNGFIKQLDYITFERICKFDRQLIDSGIEPLRISFNVSKFQTNYSVYLNKINEIRTRFNIPAKYFEIEIAESIFSAIPEVITSFITEAKALGFYVDIDDFGVGNSNINTIVNLDYDVLKLDRLFCDKTNNSQKVILEATISVCKKLNKKVLYEGVETEIFKDYLKSIGCDYIQGFLIDTPIEQNEFYEKYIKATK